MSSLLQKLTGKKGSGTQDGSLKQQAPTLDNSNAIDDPEAQTSSSNRAEELDDDDDSLYPHGFQLAVLIIAIAVSTFLVALDATIIATAIPTITSQFNSLDEYGWYNAAYLLSQTVFQLPYGRAYTLLSTKWTYLWSIFVFEVGTLICGVAPTSIALIIGRAIAGLGGAGIFSGSLIIIAQNTPLKKRSLYAGVLGGMFGLASVTGPLIGGAFTTNISWRWCFYINLPLGGIALVIVFFCLSNSRRASEELKSKTWRQILWRFDPIGALLLLPSLICLLIALEWGGVTCPWSDGRMIALFVVFGVLFVAWIISQVWQGDNATLPVSVATQRSVICASLYTLFAASAFSLVVFYIQLWFQAIQHNNAEQSGIHNIPIVLSVVVFSLGAGIAVVLIGYYVPFLIGGSICIAVGAALLMELKPNSSTGTWIGYEILFGAGIGMSFEQCNVAIQAVLPKEKVPSGTSLVLFCRSLSGTLAVTIGQLAFAEYLSKGLNKNLPNLDPSIVSQSGATNLVKNLQKATGGNGSEITIILNVYNYAITRIFMVALITGALSILPAFGVEWKNVKKQKKKEKEVEEEK